MEVFGIIALLIVVPVILIGLLIAARIQRSKEAPEDIIQKNYERMLGELRGWGILMLLSSIGVVVAMSVMDLPGVTLWTSMGWVVASAIMGMLFLTVREPTLFLTYAITLLAVGLLMFAAGTMMGVVLFFAELFWALVFIQSYRRHSKAQAAYLSAQSDADREWSQLYARRSAKVMSKVAKLTGIPAGIGIGVTLCFSGFIWISGAAESPRWLMFIEQIFAAMSVLALSLGTAAFIAKLDRSGATVFSSAMGGLAFLTVLAFNLLGNLSTLPDTFQQQVTTAMAAKPQAVFSIQDNTRDFGVSLSASGDRLLIGAPSRTRNQAGRAYLFGRNSAGQWEQEAVFEGQPSRPDFGVSVSLDGDTAVVGSSGAFSIYSFADEKWQQAAEIVDDPPDPDYGRCIQIEDGSIVVLGTGAAWVERYAKEDGNWLQQWIEYPFSSPPPIGMAFDLNGDRLTVFARDRWEDTGRNSVTMYKGPRLEFAGYVTLAPSTTRPVIAVYENKLAAISTREGEAVLDIYYDGETGGWNREPYELTLTRSFGEKVAIGSTIALTERYLLVQAIDPEGDNLIYLLDTTSGVPDTWRIKDVLSHPEGQSEFGDVVALGDTYLAVRGSASDAASPDEHSVYLYDPDKLRQLPSQSGEVAQESQVDTVEDSLPVPTATAPTFPGKTRRLEPAARPELLSSDGNWLNEFGYALALNGETLVVGAPSIFGDAPGRVFMFQRSGSGGWIESKAPLAQQGIPSFGRLLAIDDQTVVVGAEGRVYLYAYADGQIGDLISEFSPDPDESSPQGDPEFGASFEIGDGWLAVGSPGASFEGSQGAVYLYHREEDGQWVQYTRLLNPSPETKRFGSHLTLRLEENSYPELDVASCYIDTEKHPGIAIVPGPVGSGAQDGGTDTEWHSDMVTRYYYYSSEDKWYSSSVDGAYGHIVAIQEWGVASMGPDLSIQHSYYSFDVELPESSSPNLRFRSAFAASKHYLVVGIPSTQDTHEGTPVVFVAVVQNKTRDEITNRLPGQSFGFIPEPPFTAATSPDYGSTLALDGHTLVVGAPGRNLPEIKYRGMVYIYELDQLPVTSRESP